MLDAFTIKEWLLIYFVALAAIGIGNIYLLLQIKSLLSMLMHECGIVQYLKAIKGD